MSHRITQAQAQANRPIYMFTFKWRFSQRQHEVSPAAQTPLEPIPRAPSLRLAAAYQWDWLGFRFRVAGVAGSISGRRRRMNSLTLTLTLTLTLMSMLMLRLALSTSFMRDLLQHDRLHLNSNWLLFGLI